MNRHSPDHAASPSLYRYLDPILLWGTRILAGAAVTMAIGPSSNASTVIADGVPSLSKHVISQEDSPLVTSPLEVPITPSASASSSGIPKPIEVTATDIPFGTPYSYVLDAKALGGTQKPVYVQPMSCPEDCDKQVINRIQYENPDPPDYNHVFYFTWPQMGLDQGNINLAHASEIPGVQLAGQNFARLQPGDRLSQTNIGWVTLTAGGKHVRVRERITRQYVETDGATSSKNSNQFLQIVERLRGNQILFATCGVPDDGTNEDRVFTEVGPPQLSPVDTKLYQSQVHALIAAAQQP